MKLLFIFTLVVIVNAQELCNYKGLVLDPDFDVSRPPVSNGTDVDLLFQIKNFDEISDTHGTMQFNGKIRLRWNETRISFSDKTEDFQWKKSDSFGTYCLWLPTLRFIGQLLFRKAPNPYNTITLTNMEEFIYIEYIMRVKVKVSCRYLDFGAFPLDSQNCSIIVGPEDHETFHIKNGTFTLAPSSNGRLQYDITIVNGIHVPWSHMKTFNGQSVAGTTIFMTRYMYPYVGIVAISELLLMTSWISFFIHHESVPGRLAPLIIILLALINIFLKESDKIPDKSNFTWLEAFLISTICQLLLVIFAYGVILAQTRKHTTDNLEFARTADKVGFWMALFLNIIILLIFWIISTVL